IFHGGDGIEGVFLPVDDAGLEGRIKLAERQGDGRSTDGIELLDQDLGVHDAEALAGEILESSDILVRGDRLAAIGPDGDGLEAERAEAIQNGLAERAGA